MSDVRSMQHAWPSSSAEQRDKRAPDHFNPTSHASDDGQSGQTWRGGPRCTKAARGEVMKLLNSLPSSGTCISVEPFETAVASSLFSIRVPRRVNWTVLLSSGRISRGWMVFLELAAVNFKLSFSVMTPYILVG